MKKIIYMLIISLFVFSTSLNAQKGKNDKEEKEKLSKKEIQEKEYANELSELEKVNLYPDERKGYWGYVNEKGRRQIDYDFDWAGDFSEELAPVMRNYKYGFINKKGELVIKFKYEDAAQFSEGLAVVYEDEKYGFINKKGITAIEFKYDDAESFKGGVALVTLEDKDGYIDKEGNLLSDNWYDEVGLFFRGICKVVNEGKVKYMNIKGKIVEVDPMSCFDQVLTRAEKMPLFKGGEDALYSFFQDRIKYPREAGENRIEGTVFLRVEIRKDGKISHVEIITGIGYGCDEEAMRIANLLPAFEPGMQDNKPVCISTIVTVDFILDLFDKQQTKQE
ncbi:TonB family protein [candidate division KSB1 bacterium]